MPTVSETGRFRFFSRSLEIATNFATLVLAVLLSVVLFRNYLLPTSSPPLVPTRSASIRPTDLATAGTNLTKRLPEIDWRKNRQTLVLVLSTQCHFCTESAPFFRQIRSSVGTNVRLIGVLPQPVVEAESYLNHEGVHLDEVK